MNSRSNLFKLLMLFFAAIVVSCGGSSNETTDESQAFDEAKEDLKKSIEEVVYNIPDPAELPYLLEATGADFNASFVNSRANADKYNLAVKIFLDVSRVKCLK